MIATIELQIVPGPSLPGHVLALLVQKAEAEGKSADAYLAEMITRKVSQPEPVPQPAKKPA